jgi:LysR family transcriptional regulator of abg operon
MKLHHFRDLVAISEHGSIRAAARHLGTAQPTLTRSLSELERELGAPLFERRSRGMVATALGQAFSRRATAILNDVRRAHEEFEQLRGNAVGLVAIGLSIAAHLWLLPKALKPFRRYPKVRLHIIEGFYPTLELGLHDGSVDFYIGPGPGSPPTAVSPQGESAFWTASGSMSRKPSACKSDVPEGVSECGMDHDLDNAEGGKRDRRSF